MWKSIREEGNTDAKSLIDGLPDGKESVSMVSNRAMIRVAAITIPKT
jgi:hypothetical protein